VRCCCFAAAAASLWWWRQDLPLQPIQAQFVALCELGQGGVSSSPSKGEKGGRTVEEEGKRDPAGSVNLRTQHGRGKPTRTFGDFEPEPASAGGERKRWWPSISLPPCMGVQQTSGRQGSLGWSPPSKLFFFRLLFIEKNDYSRKRDEAPGILAILNAANF